jgi:hypothetical protein
MRGDLQFQGGMSGQWSGKGEASFHTTIRGQHCYYNVNGQQCSYKATSYKVTLQDIASATGSQSIVLSSSTAPRPPSDRPQGLYELDGPI